MPQIEPLEIARVVRELRQHLNLSQEKFAARLGVSFKSVYRWENGQTTPSPLAMEKINGLLKQIRDAPSGSDRFSDRSHSAADSSGLDGEAEWVRQ